MLLRSLLRQCSYVTPSASSKSFQRYDIQRDSRREVKPEMQWINRQRKTLHRLYTEHEISDDDMLDAYMCGTQDKIYPKWVFDLPAKEREDILSAKAIGMKAFDAQTHERLAKMSPKKRIFEWEKIKLARQYEQGASGGRWENGEYKRNFIRNSHSVYHRNIKTRHRKMTQFRRELRNLDPRSVMMPTDRVDLSFRFARAAEMVLKGQKTKGQWPPEKVTHEGSKPL